MRALYLHKRDFRFFDNEILTWLEANQAAFFSVYVWEPSLMATSEFADMHQFAVTQALDALRTSYKKDGICLIECLGEMVDRLEALHERIGFDTLVSHMEHGTQGTFARDIAVKGWCKAKGIKWTEFAGSTVKRGLKNRDEREKIWKAHMTERMKPVPKNLAGLPISNGILQQFESQVNDFRQAMAVKHKALDFANRLQPVSERAAHNTLQEFLTDRSVKYRGGISSPNTALTHGSRLSVHLAWGTVSIRCIYRTAQQKMFELENPLPDGKPSASDRRHKLSLKSFTARLHWRDHFIQRLEDQPDMPDHALSSAFESIAFLDAPDRLEAWRHGLTGEPMVDACMRCLQETGFINFRMRSMCISYGVYGLHLDWRLLGRALAEIFLDYEPGIHWSQVQMQAGVVGINTIRVYSPQKQLLDQDPECQFVKRWIPELAQVSADEILNYDNFLADLGAYPAPIVSFKDQSAAMKKVMYGVKNGAENREAKVEVLRRHGSRVFKPRARKPSLNCIPSEVPNEIQT